MNENLRILIEDCKKILNVREVFFDIKSMKIDDPIETLIKHGINYGVISSVKDVLELCKEIPVLTDYVSNAYEEHIKKESDNHYKEYYKYAGTYNRLEDVPGYGTEWNNRCIPAGVIIRNNRC